MPDMIYYQMYCSSMPGHRVIDKSVYFANGRHKMAATFTMVKLQHFNCLHICQISCIEMKMHNAFGLKVDG